MTTAIADLLPGQPGYPQRLTALGWGRTLHLRGTLREGPAVAIVGARAASARGMERAHALSRHLASRGVAVVSGGALGIDGAAHRGALAGSGTTTVVLGSGVDVAYPTRHTALFEQVLQSGGALLSMLPNGTEPRSHTFPQRNPLIAALADVVLVIEAEVRSGSLSTARAAHVLGRIVCAWPGSRGCDRLIASGSGLIESEADVDAALAGAPRVHVPLSLDPTARAIADAIAAGACGVDAIIAATGLPVRTVLRALPSIGSIDVSSQARKL